MKKIFFTLAGLFTIIALILSFQNIAMSVPIGIFFEYTNTNLFVPLFLLFCIGVVAGFFFALGLRAKSSPGGGGDGF